MFKLKSMTRIVSLILAAVMASTMAVSCGKDTGNGGSETNETGSGNDNTELTESQQLVEQLYGGKKSSYKGRKFRILAIPEGNQWYTYISDTANEVWFEDAGSDVFQKSIYERNHQTETLLGIEIVPVWGGNANDIAGRIITDKDAGSDDYDVALTTLSGAMGCAQNDGVINLMDYSSFDPSHTWWNQTFVEQCTLFGNQLYTIAGAINIWDDCSNRMMMFNQDVLDKYNCTDPYQQVFDGTWTVANMMESAKKCTHDTNGDGDLDENDDWGVGSGGMMLYDCINGLDTNVAVMGDEGYPVILSKNEDHIKKVEYFFQNTINTDYFYCAGVTGDSNSDYFSSLFVNNQLAFAYGMLASSFSLRDMEAYCGVLPNAKYNEEQAEYTSAANVLWFTSYVIPKICTDPEYAATCLEVMSGYSVDTLDYNLNDVVFQSKVARDQNARDCFNIIKTTLSFDWAFIGSWRGNLVSAYELKYGYPFTVVSNVEACFDVAQESLDAMIEIYRDRSF